MVKIRRMKIDDLPGVWKLGTKELELDKKVYHKYWDQGELFKSFAKEPEYCLVAEDEGRIIGFGIGHSQFSQWTDDIAKIEWIAIHRKHRRKGIGTQICAQLIKDLRKDGAKKIVVDVESTNLASMRMLERLSFREIFSVNWLSKELTS
jgi:ribosomal protein S18 acetylase RimI-like enzyme